MFDLMPYDRRRRLAAYDPFAEILDWRKSLLDGSGLKDFRTDIKDAGDAYELAADLPGCQKEDIHVELNDGYLTVRAERRCENEEKDEKDRYIHRERSWGVYKRSFDVGHVDTDKISAVYKDGVLKLTLPKRDPEKPVSRSIDIQ
ncbi:MAG: Hsp20/alpha crystallin family protein [Firmicutes bacterium]|nr:Hsp20/alpha crystallin family protein [Bacillota bacterium]